MTHVRGKVSVTEVCHNGERSGAAEIKINEDNVSRFGMLIALIHPQGDVCMNHKWGSSGDD